MKSSILFNQQRGAALIISLVILIAMTLLAVTSMKGTSTEVAMAGNLRESALTFQAAEAGLRSAETAVEGTKATSIADIERLVTETEADPDYLSADSWDAENIANLVLTSVGINSPPKYIVKFVGENSVNRLSLVNTGAGYSGAPKGKVVTIFRITARASGQTGKAFRTVQSHYGIEYK
jgi:type IV pilus assembly protein PilX